MTPDETLQNNLVVFKEYTLGDKLTITFRNASITELGTLTAFGYDDEDRLLLGIQIITDFRPRDQVDVYLNKDAITWYHPNSAMCIIKKVGID
jgi:hypothetical protein